MLECHLLVSFIKTARFAIFWLYNDEFNPFYTKFPQTGTMTIIEDLDEMQHKTVCQYGPELFAKIKTIFTEKYKII